MLVKSARTILRIVWGACEVILRQTLSVGAIIGMSSVDSHAYLDGGAGSYIIQIILAGVFTLTFFLGKIRERIGKAWQALVLRRNSNQKK
jgi:hypothetical protein